ncbi:hypothetical protein C0995_011423 [Termitomyces sp. Mi166|nr:hypothetical protein C0995_011423 [Termitomyces sp. Mi166\
MPVNPDRDGLSLRKILQDALTQTFGVTSAGLYIDVLWMAEDSSECIIKSHKDYRCLVGRAEFETGQGIAILALANRSGRTLVTVSDLARPAATNALLVKITARVAIKGLARRTQLQSIRLRDAILKLPMSKKSSAIIHPAYKAESKFEIM